MYFGFIYLHNNLCADKLLIIYYKEPDTRVFIVRQIMADNLIKTIVFYDRDNITHVG